MRCVEHSNREATRQCSTCQRGWCPVCVKTSIASGKTIEYCAKCKGRLQEPAARMVDPVLDLGDLITRPFSSEGLLTALAIAIGAWLAWVPAFGRLFSIASAAALVGYYFQIIDHIGSDKSGLPGPSDNADTPGQWIAQIARGLLCLLVGLAPLMVWYYKFRNPDALPMSNGLVSLGLIVAGMVYMPAALLSVVLTGSTFGALYPIAWVKIVARAPVGYLKLVLLFMLSAVAYVLTLMFSSLVAGLIPLVGGIVVGTATNLMLFVQACLVGGFLRRHADQFGWD